MKRIDKNIEMVRSLSIRRRVKIGTIQKDLMKTFNFDQ